MTEYSHDNIVPFKDSDKSKKQQVAEMFNKIAFRYDFMNRFLSVGIDQYWRKTAIKQLMDVKPRYILDVATGTGDLAIMTAKLIAPEKIIGIDISEGMLELGRKKVEKEMLNDKIALQVGDSEAINFPDNTFDAITIAFGIRNFEDLDKGLAEMKRVLKPGGKLVILEFSKPKQPIFSGLYNVYMKVFAPGVASWVSKNKEAYSYLHSSVKAFPEGETFLHILQKHGYSSTTLKRLSLGICTIYCGRKEE